LSAETSVELIKAYTLRELNDNELSVRNPLLPLDTQLLQEPKIQICQGVPGNLIMLAMALRVLPLDKIKLEQVVAQNDFLEGQEGVQESQKVPASFA
jgi:hypothetical protein